MRDSVPSVRYSSVYNVLRLWRISLIPTYKSLPDSMTTDSMIPVYTYVYIVQIWAIEQTKKLASLEIII